MTSGWFDDAAGPVVRPYAVTRGRTRGAADAKLDTVALVIAQSTDGTADETADPADAVGGRVLSPEHLDILTRCRRTPRSVAELAAGLDVPVCVVRVLIGDLLDAELVRVSRPVPKAQLPDENTLREVADRLRRL